VEGESSVRRAAVLGTPIAHSLSPVIHSAGYLAAGLAGWRYTALECAESELTTTVAGLGRHWAGLSLTMPLKEVGLSVADEIDPLARALGATNTLVRTPGQEPADAGCWRALNTDAPGMVDALGRVGVVRAGEVAVLGGGAARCACHRLCPQIGRDREARAGGRGARDRHDRRAVGGRRWLPRR
jgi:shikimate dehydrogenase